MSRLLPVVHAAAMFRPIVVSDRAVGRVPLGQSQRSHRIGFIVERQCEPPAVGDDPAIHALVSRA